MKTTIFKELLHSLVTSQGIQFSYSSKLSWCVKKKSLSTVKRFSYSTFISTGLSWVRSTWMQFNVPVNSKTTHPPRAIPGHLTRVELRTVGNLTQNEAHPVGHLTFLSKRLSAVGNTRFSQFFDSACEPRSQVIALVDSYVGFSVVVGLYSYIV